MKAVIFNTLSHFFYKKRGGNRWVVQSWGYFCLFTKYFSFFPFLRPICFSSPTIENQRRKRRKGIELVFPPSSSFSRHSAACLPACPFVCLFVLESKQTFQTVKNEPIFTTSCRLYRPAEKLFLPASIPLNNTGERWPSLALLFCDLWEELNLN